MRIRCLPSSASAPAGAALLALMFATTGCGDPDGGTVSGQVRFNDAPLPAGTVTFHGADSRSASAFVEADGRYTATRVPLGAVKVTVATPRQMGDKARKALEKSRKTHIETRGETVSIPDRYGKPEQSGLTLTVTPGGQNFDIDLVNSPVQDGGEKAARKNNNKK